MVVMVHEPVKHSWLHTPMLLRPAWLLLMAYVAADRLGFQCQATHDLTFRLGIVVGNIGQCAGMEDANLGHQLFVNKLSTDAGALHITDRENNTHRVLFNYTRYNDDCEFQKHMDLIEKLLQEDEVQFVHGSSPVFAVPESVIVNNAGRMIYQCCFGPDSLYQMDMKHVFGIQQSNAQYPTGVLMQMAETGDIKRLYIFSLEDDPFTSSTCNSAAKYTSDVIGRLYPNFELVKFKNYTAQEAAAVGFYKDLVTEAVDLQADAIVGCDLLEAGNMVTEAVASKNHHLKVVWLTVAPAYASFVPSVGEAAAKHIMTAGQWHDSVSFTDPYFGSAKDYSAEFTDAFGHNPSYVAAGASAASYSLAVAIQDAFALCKFLEPNLDADNLLFNASAIECVNAAGAPVIGTGYELVHASLAQQNMVTFFGEILFNKFRRNTVIEPITMQIQSGVLEAVLPLDVATRLIQMTIFRSTESSKSKNIGVLTQGQFVAVVVVVVGFVLLVCLSAVVFMWVNGQWRTKGMDTHLVISPKDLRIINQPVVRLDGTWESGKGIYRNALVAIDPLDYIKMAGVSDTSRPIDPKDPAQSANSDRPRNSGSDSDNLEEKPTRRNTGIQDSEDPTPSNDNSKPLTIESKSSQRLSPAMSKGTLNNARSAESEGHDVPSLLAHIMLSVDQGADGAGAPEAPLLDPRISLFTEELNERADKLPAQTSLPSPKLSHHIDIDPKLSRKDTKDSESVLGSFFRIRGQPGSATGTPTSIILTKLQMLKLLWRLKCLQHPSVIPIIGVVWSLPILPANMPLLVRECQELGALSCILENETMELDNFKQIDIAKDLAQALAYLHAQVHPKLRPVMQPQLTGVLLNRYCKAKLLVQFLPLLDVLNEKRLLFSSSFQKKEEIVCPKARGAEELEDVMRYGMGIARLLTTASHATRLSASRVRAQGLMAGSMLSQAQYQTIVNEHSQGLADLVRQCCATDPQDRPSFTEIHMQIEALNKEMMQHPHQFQQTSLRANISNPNLRSLHLAQHKPSADSLLYELFPTHVAEALKRGQVPDPEPYPCVSIFFSDVCGYTDICSKLRPEEVMDMLHRLYSRFDALAQELCLFKVETVGDAWMGVANLHLPTPDSHARLMTRFAFGCVAAANELLICPDKPEMGNIHIRVGIHAGPVVGAVVGTLNRRFGLFGDTVNVASRMESTSIKDHIQCSAAFYELLEQQWAEVAEMAVPQGARTIKGKGTMQTYMLFPVEQKERAKICQQQTTQVHKDTLHNRRASLQHS